MATAAVSIAPVLTPQTLGVLADTLERADRPEQALSLRSLQPFVQAVVERYFLPLTARRGRFSNRFKRLASEFEPVRLYLNFRLLSAFGSPEFLNFYGSVALFVGKEGPWKSRFAWKSRKGDGIATFPPPRLRRGPFGCNPGRTGRVAMRFDTRNADRCNNVPRPICHGAQPLMAPYRVDTNRPDAI
jgi:hypothetical protein